MTTFTQTVIKLAVGSGGNTFDVTVSCGVDAALKELDRAKRQGAEDYENTHSFSRNAWAKFQSPSAEGRVKSRPIAIPPEKLHDVISIFEQEVTIVDDPRMAGQTRTQSGIALPAL